MTTTDAVESCRRALSGAEAMMKNVRPEDLDTPSRCSEWDVRTLANHMVGVCHNFALAAGREETAPAEPGSDLIGADAGQSYARAAAAAMAAWSAPGALEGTVKGSAGEMPAMTAIGICTIDQLLHTWDLAQSLGRACQIDPDLAETALAITRTLVMPERRGTGKPFAEEVLVAADAPVQERLLAFAGRQP
jgi:uncharacterized protein (TIGR03086 family)